jgi:membrane protein insertase Oxa1/YidC/SpoIIIJ
MPSGLNFYIMCSNFAGILEQKRIRQHVEKEEKDGKFNAPASTSPKPKGWLMRQWEKLLKEAEEAKRIQSEKKKR